MLQFEHHKNQKYYIKNFINKQNNNLLGNFNIFAVI